MKGAYTAQDARSIQRMFARIAQRYDLANTLLSAGMDHFWRQYVARQVAGWRPRRVLDVASGSGALASAIQRAVPGAEVVGADFCAPLLLRSRRRRLSRLVVADALALPFADGVFDVVTVAFGLRNMASYDRALSEMRRVLAPGGHVVILDFSIPTGPWLPLYRVYLHRVLPRLAGWLTGAADAYEYLGQSIEAFPRGQAMTALLNRVGFSATKCRPLSTGVVSVYTASTERAGVVVGERRPCHPRTRSARRGRRGECRK
jgi:demethylmenaquinone methyltransferase / 2-methoxy-6-polyprenyl-1,4-benzoquinol methylase